MKEQRLAKERPVMRNLRTSHVVRRLAALGFTLPALTERGELRGETALRIYMDSLLRDGRYALKLQRRLDRYAAKRNRVCLLPVVSANGSGDATGWREFCGRLGELCPPRVEPPALCVHSHLVRLDEYRDAKGNSLIAGARYVYCDSLQMQAHADARVKLRTDSNWRALWRSRLTARPLAPVYGGFVRSACPLLADEAAAAVLPASGLNVPLNTGWLPLGLDLTGFADGAGRLDLADLRQALREAIPIADELLGKVVRPNILQRRDVTENRRLALLVKGIGDLVLRRARDPADFDCLRELHSDLAAIRSAVDETSAHQARRRGPLPALFLPPRAWFDGDHAEQWLQHFEAARRREAVRHRNLLAMSPYSVMPSGSGCDPAFADLLPLLAFADAWAFSDPPRLENWNLNQFKHFHTRARAIIQASQATTRIAAGA